MSTPSSQLLSPSSASPDLGAANEPSLCSSELHGSESTVTSLGSLKTEYKSKFTPFDQYVYNEVTDSFIRPPCGSPVVPATSGDHLLSESLVDGQLSDTLSCRASSAEQPTVEPWYKEVQRRNEKANEYRFKSEVGHSSPSHGNEYKRDHLIAHLANNNNFNLPKEAGSSRVGHVASSTARSTTRTPAQVRSRSQSTRRTPATPSSTNKNTNLTPTRAPTRPPVGRPSPHVTSSSARTHSAAKASPAADAPARRPATSSSRPATRPIQHEPTSSVHKVTSTISKRPTTATSRGVAAPRHTPASTSTRQPISASNTTPNLRHTVASKTATPNARGEHGKNGRTPSGTSPAVKSIKTPKTLTAAAAVAGAATISTAALANPTSTPKPVTEDLVKEEPREDVEAISAREGKLENETTSNTKLLEPNVKLEPQTHASPSDEPRVNPPHPSPPDVEPTNFMFSGQETGNMLADELAEAEREAELKKQKTANEPVSQSYTIDTVLDNQTKSAGEYPVSKEEEEAQMYSIVPVGGVVSQVDRTSALETMSESLEMESDQLSEPKNEEMSLDVDEKIETSGVTHIDQDGEVEERGQEEDGLPLVKQLDEVEESSGTNKPSLDDKSRDKEVKSEVTTASHVENFEDIYEKIENTEPVHGEQSRETKVKFEAIDPFFEDTSRESEERFDSSEPTIADQSEKSGERVESNEQALVEQSKDSGESNGIEPDSREKLWEMERTTEVLDAVLDEKPSEIEVKSETIDPSFEAAPIELEKIPHFGDQLQMPGEKIESTEPALIDHTLELEEGLALVDSETKVQPINVDQSAETIEPVLEEQTSEIEPKTKEKELALEEPIQQLIELTNQEPHLIEHDQPIEEQSQIEDDLNKLTEVGISTAESPLMEDIVEVTVTQEPHLSVISKGLDQVEPKDRPGDQQEESKFQETLERPPPTSPQVEPNIEELEVTEQSKPELLMDVNDLLDEEARRKQEMSRKSELARKNSSPLTDVGEVLLSPTQLDLGSQEELDLERHTNRPELEKALDTEGAEHIREATAISGSSINLLDPIKALQGGTKKLEGENGDLSKVHDNNESLDDLTDKTALANAIFDAAISGISDESQEAHGELYRQLHISPQERKLSLELNSNTLMRKMSSRSNSSTSTSASSSASSSLERVVQNDIKSDYEELAARMTTDLLTSDGVGGGADPLAGALDGHASAHPVAHPAAHQQMADSGATTNLLD